MFKMIFINFTNLNSPSFLIDLLCPKIIFHLPLKYQYKGKKTKSSFIFSNTNVIIFYFIFFSNVFLFSFKKKKTSDTWNYFQTNERSVAQLLSCGGTYPYGFKY